MKMFTYKLGFLCPFILLLSACAGNNHHDTPRQLPWTEIDISQASHELSVLDNGQIQLVIKHQPLINITPEMVSWFYRNLPISKIQYQGNTLPWYHIFHPTEHGQIEVLEQGNNEKVGMSEGALVQRFEWFGDYDSKGKGRIIAMDDNLMHVKPEMFGQHFGDIRHEFRQQPWGTEYVLTSVIGSESGFLSPLINSYVRNIKFPPEMLKQWIRHQKQEVASLNYFLPKLYQQKDSEKYKLD
jgi:hypothetical protein